MLYRPNFIIFIEMGTEEDYIRTLSSCNCQIYPASLITNKKIDVVHSNYSEPFLLWLKAGDSLDQIALYEFASLLNSDPRIKLIYSDEIPDQSLHNVPPFYKPSWSPDYLESMNYIGSSACYSLTEAKELFELSNCQYDFLLRFTEVYNLIEHINKTLITTKSSQLNKLNPIQDNQNKIALSNRLFRTGRIGNIVSALEARGIYRVVSESTLTPLVSIVIPTAGKVILSDGLHIDLIANCINSIINYSTYKNIEFIVVDNGDFDRDRLKNIDQASIRFASYTDHEVNIAKKLNIGASLASGEYLILLNDDIQLISPNWIESLLTHFEKEYVGVVGAKLLYPNMTIQHAGVVSVSSHPEHVSKGIDRNDPGYYFNNLVSLNYSSVTGALQMTKSRIYRELGGYDEDLPLCFNDIDYCYKVLRMNKTVVYEPSVELIHHESVSAPNSFRPRDRDVFVKKWSYIFFDSYYNENIKNIGKFVDPIKIEK
jgi:GT2 family glycosyltransferase